MATVLCRRVLEAAESALSGSISIEDVTVQSTAGDSTLLRRMVFTSNRNLVQSEAVLCPGQRSSRAAADAASTSGAAGAGKESKARGKAAKQKAGSSKTQVEAQQASQAQKLVVDHSQLACDYHKGIVAGLTLIQPHLSSIAQRGSSQQEKSQQAEQAQQAQHVQRASSPLSGCTQQTEQQQDRRQEASDAQTQGQAGQAGVQQRQEQPDRQQQASEAEVQGRAGQEVKPRALVVGLGGGSLPMFLNRHCSMDVQSVELDPVVVGLARRHFGFQDSARLQASTSGLLLMTCCLHTLEHAS